MDPETSPVDHVPVDHVPVDHVPVAKSMRARPKAKQERRAARTAALAAGGRGKAVVAVASSATAADAATAKAADAAPDTAAAAAAPKVLVKQVRPGVGQRPAFPAIVVPRGYRWVEVAASTMGRLSRLPQPCAAAVLCSNHECNNLHFVERYIRNRGGVSCPECGSAAVASWYLEPPRDSFFPTAASATATATATGAPAPPVASASR